MKVLIYTDIHIDKNFFKNPLLTKIENYRVRRFLLETLEKTKPDLQLFLGDMFNVVDNIDIVPYIRMRQFLEGKNEEKGLVDFSNIYMIPGNHDFLSMKSPFNLLDTLNNVSSREKGYTITVFKNNSIKVLPIIDIDSTFVFVPYIHEAETLKTTLLSLKEKMKTFSTKNIFIFGHFGITEYAEFFKRGETNGVISTRDLGKYFLEKTTRMYLGHFHARKSLLNNKIQVIGNTHCHSFSDIEDLDRGALLLDIKGDGTFTEEYINNPYSPLYIKTHYQDLINYKGKYSNKDRAVFLEVLASQKDPLKNILKENEWILSSFDHYRIRDNSGEERFLKLKDFDFDLNNYSGLDIMQSFKEFLLKEKDRVGVSEEDISVIATILKHIKNEDEE